MENEIGRRFAGCRTDRGAKRRPATPARPRPARRRNAAAAAAAAADAAAGLWHDAAAAHGRYDAAADGYDAEPDGYDAADGHDAESDGHGPDAQALVKSC